MFGMAQRTDITAEIRNDVAAYLYDQFTSDDSQLSGLDRWTQRRVTDENMTKITLVMEANDSVEYCYQNLVREIDAEAKTGIFLARSDASSNELRELARDPGISGKLHEEMGEMAPALSAVQARYERAKIDATTSEIVMNFLAKNDTDTADMSMALRALLYSFHEGLARRGSGLQLILNDRNTRDLNTMVSELFERAGTA